MNDYEPLKGFEKLYAINRGGSLWSYISNKELKPCLNSNGYYRIDLYKNNGRKNYLIHRLLALQFIPNPLGLRCIDHINGNRTDNRLEKLRWVTHRQNDSNKTNSSVHPYIKLTRYGYQVSFRVNGKKTYFGTYKTLDEALSERDCQLDIHGIENLCYGFEPVNNYL